jgi:alkylated DNA repair dioxygenase AlkB
MADAPPMSSLFASSEGFERLRLPEAEVYLQRHFPSSIAAAIAFERLVAETNWRSETIRLWGKTIAQPRLTAWHGDAGRDYTYSGLTMKPEPWTPLLQTLKSEVERAAGETFNSVLLNYYRNERDSVGYHSDDEKELGPEPTIASLSLGDTRTFVFKSKRKLHKSMRLALEEGSLLLMKGPTQRNWLHAIEKETQPRGPRINLTFRRILDSEFAGPCGETERQSNRVI